MEDLMKSLFLVLSCRQKLKELSSWMDDYSIDNPESDRRHEGFSSQGGGIRDIESFMEVLTKADVDLAYSSEKLVNLHGLLIHLLAWDDDLEVVAMENSYISTASFEKALVFDLLSGIFDSEVREVENFVDNIQADIVDARHKIFSNKHSTELVTIMGEKLHDTEESLYKTQERLAEVKKQSIKLQSASPTFRLENWKEDKSLEFSANNQLQRINADAKWGTAEQKRNNLGMLDKSLAREMYLEKKLSELRQSEEQLKLKLHYTEQVTFRMEEAAEVVWGRFLEAENAAEVLMGISKELVGRIQIVQLNLNGSLQREAELKSELEDCRRQLDAKNTALRKLEISTAEHVTKSLEVPTLMEKVNSLEEQLKRSELCLKHANEFNEDIQEQLSELENIVDSLKDNIYEAEIRAETAEAKVTQLTDTNLELTEEINFLKSSADSNNKKVSLLEKQVRELEIQQQHSKVSSEASQEQQNMLYSAIWDMETLIEDLKSKVSKAENKTESTEEQFIILSETNMELGKELSFLRSRVKSLEVALDQANNSKAAGAKEIDLKTRLIMDTVRQLAQERELIQNQLFSLTRENKLLVEKLRNAKSDAHTIVHKDGDVDVKKVPFSESNLSNETFGKASEEAMSLSKSSQVDKVIEDANPHEIEEGSSHHPTDESCDLVSKLEVDKTEQAGKTNRVLNFKAILVAVIAGVAIYLLHKKPLQFENF